MLRVVQSYVGGLDFAVVSGVEPRAFEMKSRHRKDSLKRPTTGVIRQWWVAHLLQGLNDLATSVAAVFIDWHI